MTNQLKSDLDAQLGKDARMTYKTAVIVSAACLVAGYVLGCILPLF